MNDNVLESYLEKLNPGKEIIRIKGGWHSMVFEVDGFIYRFANQSFEDYQQEAFLCDHLRSQVFFSLPKVDLVNSDPFRYAKHKKLQGTTKEWNDGVDELTINDCALALAQIHSCADLPFFRKVCDPVPPPVEKDCLHSVLNSLFSKEEVTLLMDAYYSSTRNKGNEEVLVHGDFRGDNILVDAHGRLKGVLDWCNAGIAERERDFNYLFADLGSESLQKLLSLYEEYSGHIVSVFRIAELALVREVNVLLMFSKDSRRRDKAKARLKSIVIKTKALKR